MVNSGHSDRIVISPTISHLKSKKAHIKLTQVKHNKATALRLTRADAVILNFVEADILNMPVRYVGHPVTSVIEFMNHES